MNTARQHAIAETIAGIRAIEADQGVTPDSLLEIKTQLLALAAQTELFPQRDFPLGEGDDAPRAHLYRLSEDDDHRFALYANSALSGIDSPVHNHTTWAVIVGVRGEEENRFYKRLEHGVEQTGGSVVSADTGICLMPDDLHSIHIHGTVEVLNFHMYGLALEQLDQRMYYRERDDEWVQFPATNFIKDAPDRAAS